tara:strand:+ start:9378 stop:9851 length:474 start_codon:yes stop_codon:yes gene_type:complete
MRNAVVTAKHPAEGWQCLYNGEDNGEAKACYRSLKLDMKDYLQICMFLTPNQRRVSRLGRVSEAELKAQAKVKREKAKHIQKELERVEKEKLEAEALEVKEADKVAKGHVERRKTERAEKAKMKAENDKQKAAHEAKKSNAVADAIVERMAKKTPKK